MIKFKTYQDVIDNPTIVTSQDPSKSVIKTYDINKSTNELEETGTNNLQEIVDSGRDSILTVAQARLMPETELQRKVQIFNNNRDKINEMQAYNDKINEYRKEFGLSPLSSTQEVLNAMKTYHNDLANAIAEGYSTLGLHTDANVGSKEEKTINNNPSNSTGGAV